jgi:hypothetical protein
VHKADSRRGRQAQGPEASGGATRLRLWAAAAPHRRAAQRALPLLLVAAQLVDHAELVHQVLLRRRSAGTGKDVRRATRGPGQRPKAPAAAAAAAAAGGAGGRRSRKTSLLTAAHNTFLIPFQQTAQDTRDVQTYKRYVHNQPQRPGSPTTAHLQPALQLVHGLRAAGHVWDGGPAQAAVAKGHVAAAEQHKHHHAQGPDVACREVGCGGGLCSCGVEVCGGGGRGGGGGGREGRG